MAIGSTAALIPSAGDGLEVTEVVAKMPGPGEVLIENHAVAVQPLDVKMLLGGYTGAGPLYNYPVVLGTSGAGVVKVLGKNVKGLDVGDRVVFDTRAYVKSEANLREGTWQKLVTADARTVARIGDVTFEQAVLIDFPLQTAVGALHLFLGMGKPGTGDAEEKVLVWGAGGAVGSYAVQYAKIVGHTIVVTASPHDVERQKKLGAFEVVDYKAADVVGRLRELGPYKYLLTASGDVASQKALASLLQPQGGTFASVLGGDIDLPPNVERVYKPFSQAAQQDEHSSFRAWWYGEYLPQVLREYLVEPVKFSRREGGLSALQQASVDVFEGKVKAKIVINPQE
ncbi:chaperonin 10-like protein [Massariosphaeria phaeospora]|uniref:Chaperonin 10-like protein n=1 Tax=Massariosphaeria phaeospora TaxID=100035 RepID=A0A7C8M182_9PLEO|nr:chaperonin 10-like protein [Massariosphaeria phaeospora]